MGMSLRHFPLRGDLGCLERDRIDLIQPVAFLDVSSLAKEALLDDSGDLRSDFNDPGGFRLPDEFRFIRDRLRTDSDDFDLRQWLRRCRVRLLLAARRRREHEYSYKAGCCCESSSHRRHHNDVPLLARLMLIPTRRLELTGASDFVDDAPRQTTGCSKFCALLPHSRQERLPLGIHEGHAGQVHHGVTLWIRSNLTPAHLEFFHPWTGESPFKQKRQRSRISRLGSFQHLVFPLAPINNRARPSPALPIANYC